MNAKLRLLLATWVAVAPAAFARDGDLIDSFGDGGVAPLGLSDVAGDTVSAPVIDDDGRLLYCATRGTESNHDFVVARVTADGTPDTSFNGDGRTIFGFGGTDDTCRAVALQADGRILVAGDAFDGTLLSFAIARLDPNGSLDATFGIGGKQRIQFDPYGGVTSHAYALHALPDGRILVAGSTNADSGRDFAIARLLADGSLDSAFNFTGRQRVRFVIDGQERAAANAMAVDASGRIVLAGYASTHAGAPSNPDFAVARLLDDGSIDATFDDDGQATIAFDIGGPGASDSDVAYAMAVQADGRIVLAGTADISANDTENLDFAIARILGNGAMDMSFGSGGRVLVPFDRTPSGQDNARSLVLDGGNILVGGFALSHAGAGGDIALLRLRANGSRDPAFGNLGRRTIDFGLTNPGIQGAYGLSRRGSQLFMAGARVPAGGEVDTFVAAIENDTVFDDGLE